MHYLANVLQHSQDVFEIPDMEDWEDELDVGVMTDASRSFLATRLATIRAIGDSLFK